MTKFLTELNREDTCSMYVENKLDFASMMFSAIVRLKSSVAKGENVSTILLSFSHFSF